MFIAKPKKAKDAEDGLMIQLKSNIREWNKMKNSPRALSLTTYEKREFPLRVQFTIYRKNKQRFDYVNIIQSLADQMVKAGYLQDDSADYFIPVFEPYEVDGKNPRTEITIL
jgi:Holliday junction resolvase RusA-like endonuclease